MIFIQELTDAWERATVASNGLGNVYLARGGLPVRDSLERGLVIFLIITGSFLIVKSISFAQPLVNRTPQYNLIFGCFNQTLPVLTDGQIGCAQISSLGVLQLH